MDKHAGLPIRCLYMHFRGPYLDTPVGLALHRMHVALRTVPGYTGTS